jgi:hypothetical protein
VALLGAPGCALFPRTPALAPPAALVSPYSDRQVWAVAPFNNESGVSIVAGDRIADAFTLEVEQIDGIDTVAVNRVIAAMRSLNITAVTTPAQAHALLRTLGVDALLVGTVTAYDPYDPPKFGGAIALFAADAQHARSLDPVAETRSRTESVAPGAMTSNAPAQASGMFDASNHMTLVDLNNYAAGRSAPASPYGQRIFLVRMDLYTQFAANRLLVDLLQQEQARLWPADATVAHTTPEHE